MKVWKKHYRNTQESLWVESDVGRTTLDREAGWQGPSGDVDIFGEKYASIQPCH